MAYQSILVPIDGSKTSLSVIDQAAELAKFCNSKVTVVQVMVLDPYIAAEYVTSTHLNDVIERARQSILKNLEEAKAKFAAHGVAVETRLLDGQVIQHEIAKVADEVKADLIIMGSHGHTGLKKLFLGSVAQNILGEVHVPVLIVRQ